MLTDPIASTGKQLIMHPQKQKPFMRKEEKTILKCNSKHLKILQIFSRNIVEKYILQNKVSGFYATYTHQLQSFLGNVENLIIEMNNLYTMTKQTIRSTDGLRLRNLEWHLEKNMTTSCEIMPMLTT